MTSKNSLYTFVLSAGLMAMPIFAEGTLTQAGDEHPLWQRLSQRLDGDGDGQITQSEFQKGNERFSRMDRNADGVLTADDFAGLPQRPRRGPGRAGLVGLADQNGDGAVTTEEWQAFATGLDQDGDGFLDEASVLQRHGRRGGPGGAEEKSAGPGLLDVNQDGRLAVSELGVVFEAMDANEDGTVSADEMPRRGLRGERGKRGRRGPRAAMHLLHQADTDQDRQLTASEWSSFTSGLDSNGDATLDREELEAARPDDAPAPRGDREISIEIARLDQLFARLDANTDGVISEDEWPRKGRRGRGQAGFGGQ